MEVKEKYKLMKQYDKDDYETEYKQIMQFKGEATKFLEETMKNLQCNQLYIDDNLLDIITPFNIKNADLL